MSEGSHRSAPAASGPSGVAVVAPHAAVLLPGSADVAAVARLWAVVTRPDVQAEQLVAVLPLRGDAEVASFGIAVHEAGAPGGTRLQVVLRGDAVIDVAADGEVRRVDARGTVPFYLATLDRVTAYRLGRAGDALSSAIADALPIVAGALASGQVGWAGDAGSVGSVDAAAAPVDVADAASAHGSADAAARARSAAVATAAIPTTAIPTAADGGDELAPPPVHAFRVVPPPAGDGIAVDAASSPDADRIPLDVPAVVGRRPRPPRVVRGRAPRLVTVASPLGEISSTHVGIRQEAGAVVVTDLDSTNGTAVLVPGSARLALHRGESLVVVPGTRIDIGDGVVLEILPAR